MIAVCLEPRFYLFGNGILSDNSLKPLGKNLGTFFLLTGSSNNLLGDVGGHLFVMGK